MIGLDTNVLVRFLVRDDEEQYERARRRIRREAQIGEPACIILVVLLEIEWVLRSRYKLGEGEISVLNPDEAMRLRNDRMELVTREDLRDLSRPTSWRGPADLIELLRERVSKPTNFDNLARSLGVAPPTSKAWVELLEKLYIVFLLPPYSKSLARSIRKDRRIYFFDCAAAYDDPGAAQLENLVACSLLKFTQFRQDAFGETGVSFT